MRLSLLLGSDQLLINDLQQTTEQQSPSGHIRYYSPDNLDHRTDMLRAWAASAKRLESMQNAGEGQEWLNAVEVI